MSWRGIQRRPRQAGVVLVTVVVVALFVPGWVKSYRLASRRRAVEAEILHLERSILLLEEERDKLINDPLYVERLARQEFSTTRKGEILLKLQQPQP